MLVVTPRAMRSDRAVSSLRKAAGREGACTISLASIGAKSIVTVSPCLTPESTLIPGPCGTFHVDSDFEEKGKTVGVKTRFTF